MHKESARTHAALGENPMTHRHLASAMIAAALWLGPHPAAAAEDAPPEPPRIAWVAGPTTVELGSEIAEVKLPESLAFAGPADAKKLLELMGNVPQGSELGLIIPKAEEEDWFIVFRFDGIGFVKDDEAGSIDADAILESIKEGTKAANEERKKRGMSTVDVVGWAEAPHYDPVSHNLTWAIRGRNEGGQEIVNYNVRVLGRAGVMELKLIDDAEKFAAAKPAVDAVLAAFAYKPGKTYAEWRPGDKVAEYGLTALVAAGAGAAAVKTGLLAALWKILAKGGKLIVVAVIGFFGVIGKAFNALRGKRDAPVASRPDAPQPPQG